MTTKICSRCKTEKVIEDFPFSNTARNIRHGQCKPCRRIMSKEHYLRNKTQYVTRAEKHNTKMAKLFQEFKDSLSCSVCGEPQACCLDFHHIRDKEFAISEAIAKVGITKLVEELEKCSVLCSNCHRKYHAGVLQVTPIALSAEQLKILMPL